MNQDLPVKTDKGTYSPFEAVPWAFIGSLYCHNHHHLRNHSNHYQASFPNSDATLIKVLVYNATDSLHGYFS